MSVVYGEAAHSFYVNTNNFAAIYVDERLEHLVNYFI